MACMTSMARTRTSTPLVERSLNDCSSAPPHTMLSVLHTISMLRCAATSGSTGTWGVVA